MTFEIKNNMHQNQERFLFIIIVLFSIGLLGYSLYRAATLSFTHDESVTYNDIFWRPVQHIISVKYATANNHIVNTLLMKFFSWLFGDNELSLRFPNIIAQLFYIIFSYFLAKRLSQPLLILCGFILLNFNPFLLDFFSLARGYGLSLSLMMGSIYFLFKYKDNMTNKFVLWWCFFCAFFAVFSSFTMVLFYLALLAIFLLIFLTRSQKDNSLIGILKELGIPLLITVLLFSFSYTPISRLIEKGQFYYGGDTGFWNDTVSSLISATFYDQPYSNSATIYFIYFIIITMMGLAIFLVFSFINRLISLKSEFIILTLLLLLPCIASMLQHCFTDSKFMMNRTALFLIPLFFLCFIFFMKELHDKIKLKPLIYTCLIVITTLFFANTIYSANLNYSLLWKYDSDTKELLDDLKMQISSYNKNMDTVKLGITWIHEPAINYYQFSRKLIWLKRVTREGFQGNFDYYYLQEEDFDQLHKSDKKIIKKYPLSRSLLIK
jgi:uncharacterized membrane protein